MSVTTQHNGMCGLISSSLRVTVVVFASATVLAGPDAADLFPHDWMEHAESQRVV